MTDAEKVKHFLHQADLNKSQSLDVAEKNVKDALEIAQKTGDLNLIISSYLLQGDIQMYRGDFLEAYKIYKNNFELASEEELTEKQVQCLLHLAVFHSNLNEIDVSISFCEQALKLNSDNNNEGAAKIYLELANSYRKTGFNEKSLEYMLKSSEIYENSENQKKYISVLIYLGKLSMDMGNYDEAMNIQFRALHLSKEIESEWHTSLIYNDLGWASFKTDNFDKALEYNLQALEYRKKLDYSFATTSSLINIGVLYKNYNKPDKAIHYLTEALDYSKGDYQFGNNSNKKRSFKILSELYKTKKDYKNSLKYLNLYVTVSDSLNKIKINDELVDLTTLFRIRKYEEEEEKQRDQQKQKFTFWWIVRISILSTVISIVYPMYKKKKTENKQLKVEISKRKKTEEILKSQNERMELMNRILRHDLTSGLAVIQSGLNIFFKEKDEKILKEVYTRNQTMVKLIRDIREFEQFMSSNSEMNVFKLSDIINEIRPNFDVDIILKKNCSFLAIKSVRSVFDNILDNAVKHGKATEIVIESEIVRNDCEIRISNNGNNIPEKIVSRIFNEGFKHGKTANTGMGLSIVKRIMGQSKGSVSVQKIQPQGVVFILQFKKFVINK